MLSHLASLSFPRLTSITKRTIILLSFTGLALTLVLPALSQTFTVSNLKIRVGRPLIARSYDNCNGSPSTMDNPFNEIQASNNLFYGFTAKSNGCNSDSSYRINGSTPWSMSGALNTVLTKGNTTFDSCGEWMNDTALSGTTGYGFVHAETACDYNNNGQTHKSMGLAVSTDSGLNWTIQSDQLLAEPNDSTDRCLSPGQAACGKETGEGDCTAVSDGTYYYLYCAKPVASSPRQTFVARALISNPYPGNWDKYQSSAWTQPGVGGTFTEITSSLGATTVHNIGQSSSIWNSNVMILGTESFAKVGGLLMSFSGMPATYSGTPAFTTLAEPLLHMDAYAYNRPSTNELIAYPSALSNTTGSHNLANHFLLFYTYVEPSSFSAPQNRYLVSRDVGFTLAGSAQTPQVGVALSRWYGTPTYGPYNTASAYWSTTAVVPGAFSTFAYQGDFGYLMTKSFAGTTPLVECAASWPGSHLDHLVTRTTCDSGYTLLRTLGWVYSASQGAATKAVYRCYDSGTASHFVSNDSACEGKTVEAPTPLGYALAN
jgi:hypothetical protein